MRIGIIGGGTIARLALEHIRAGGDLCLVCHQEDLITRAYEALVREAERDRKFAIRARESHQRVLQLKMTLSAQFRARYSGQSPHLPPSGMR